VQMLPAFASVTDVKARFEAAAETNAPDEVPVLAREIALDNVSFSYLAQPGCRRDVAARCH